MMKLSTLYSSQCYLGESPVWHAARGTCLWVDIENGILYELNWTTKKVQSWNIHSRVSVIIQHHDGGLVLGVQGGMVKFNFDDGSLDWLVDIEKNIPDNRCNDGACDNMGRIWMGVMNIHAEPKAGSLYCIHHDFTVQQMITGLTIPNGLVWSLDQERMYFVDSEAGNINSYLFNNQTGEIRFEKAAIHIPEDIGVPDGMAIDEQGMLWIAIYGGYCVSRWDPQTGSLLATIILPVPHVTNCCFVGDELQHLMITTARENLDEQQLKDNPQSGDVFIVENVGVKGIVSHKAVHIKPSI